MERKEFIRRMGLVCFSACGLSTLLESCNSIFYLPHAVTGKQIVIRKADIPANKYLLVKDEQLPAPLYLHQHEGQYSAVLMLCTHKACELNPAGSVLICPCHGSEFSPSGKVLQGPADTDLKMYTISADAEHIYIQL